MTKATEKKIRVLVVDDSAFMCKVLQEIINSDPQLEVAGQGRDGREAVALAESLRPDVITMDINMPHIDGLQATELIMSQHPRPIVIVSSESREGAASTLRALELGAIDFVPKPSSGIDLDMRNVREDLTRKLKLAAKVRVVRTATRSKLPAPHAPASASRRFGQRRAAGVAERRKISDGRDRRVHGRSGGRDARGRRLAEGFAGGRVPRAAHAAGVHEAIYVAACGNRSAARERSGDATNRRSRERSTSAPARIICGFPPPGKLRSMPARASKAIAPARTWRLNPSRHIARALTLGVVLTGMGNDAAKGVKAVKAAGGYVFAQDEATSMIFGMPAEAIKTGAVDEVLALDANWRGD